MPVPSCVRPRAPLDAVEPLEQARQLVGGDADAGVARRVSSTRPPASRSATAIAALEGELEGVGEQIEDDLLPHLAVDVDRLAAAAGSRRPARSPARSHGRAEDAGQLGGERGEVGRLVAAPATRPASMREKSSSVLTSLQQPQPVAVDDLELLRAVGGGASGLGEQRPRAGPSISVSGVRNSWLTLLEERGLGAVELGQRLGAPPLLLVGPGVGDGGGDLAGHQARRSRGSRRRARGAGSPRPPAPGRLRLARRDNRQHDGAGRRRPARRRRRERVRRPVDEPPDDLGRARRGGPRRPAGSPRCRAVTVARRDALPAVTPCAATQPQARRRRTQVEQRRRARPPGAGPARRAHRAARLLRGCAVAAARPPRSRSVRSRRSPSTRVGGLADGDEDAADRRRSRPGSGL